MYKNFFGLRENPFNLTPDPEYLYMSSVHREALSHLLFGIEQRKGFVMITGEVGAGKTTLCRSLLTSLPKKTHTALILNPSVSAIELLKTINQEFGLRAKHRSKKDLLDDLNNFLLDILADGGNAVIIIDECQNLAPEVLEQVRMLSNLETEKEKLLQIILVGQPELEKTLSSPSLQQINDRITLRYYMGPLSVSETGDYIDHRLTVAGSHGDIKFTRSAVKLIYNYSRGLPRRINVVCERAMIFAYLKGTRKMGKYILKSSIKELSKGKRPRSSLSPKWITVTVTAVAVLVFVGLLWQTSFKQQVSSQVSSIFNQISKRHVVKVKETAEKTTNKDYSWILQDYDRAYIILHTLPDVSRAFETLNLHPQPDMLKYISRPFIACLDEGYAVVIEVDKDHARLIGPNKDTIDVPIEKFNTAYKWNVMVPYKKEEGVKTCQLTDQGEDVLTIQSILKRYGYLVKKPDGFYDFETAKGVKKVQELFGLTRDGIAGPDTFTLLEIIGKGKG